jgi:3-oxoacyl-[acyl-carrier-protein] synthase II
MAQKHRVVVTGLGLVSPVGNNVKDSWNSLMNSKSGISELEGFGEGNHHRNIGGLVKGEQEFLDSIFPRNKQRKTSRFMRLAVQAAHEAMTDAGLDRENPIERGRLGTYLGVGMGGLEVLAEAISTIDKLGVKAISPFAIPRAIINQAAGWIAMEWNLQGPMVGVCNACASGTDAIGLAFNAIQSGVADYMISGGSEASLNQWGLAAFGNMRALSNWKGDAKSACRPFDKDRSGFVMAEGAGILVLERLDLAQKRGAKIYGEIVGYGAAADAYHLTAMQPDGRGAVFAIRQAIKQAQINSDDVGYVNAHGTSTAMNDEAEVKILKTVFADKVNLKNPKRILVSSTKSMTGHMIGGAGGAEAIFSLLALKNQIVPPTINLDNPDKNFDIDFVAYVAREHEFKYALSNSFGFGGGNSVLAFKKFS